MSLEVADGARLPYLCTPVGGVAGLPDELHKMLQPTAGPKANMLKGTERHDDGSRVPEGRAAQAAQPGSPARNGERGHISDEKLATA